MKARKPEVTRLICLIGNSYWKTIQISLKLSKTGIAIQIIVGVTILFYDMCWRLVADKVHQNS